MLEVHFKRLDSFIGKLTVSEVAKVINLPRTMSIMNEKYKLELSESYQYIK